MHKISWSHVYLRICVTMQTTFPTCSAKENDPVFCCQIHLQKQKYGLHFWKQTAVLVMLMNHSTTQPCRIVRLAQAAMFTSQFLKADNTSVTSTLPNHVLKCLKLGTAQPQQCPASYQGESKPQNNMVYIFWSISSTWKYSKDKVLLW